MSLIARKRKILIVVFDVCTLHTVQYDRMTSICVCVHRHSVVRAGGGRGMCVCVCAAIDSDMLSPEVM